MSILNIRNKIVAALQTIDPKLRVYPYIPNNPQEQTFIYLHYTSVNNIISYSKTLSELNFNITVCTLMVATIEEAQALMDSYVDATGANSIRAKVESGLTPAVLMPDASHAHLTAVADFARYSFAGQPYYGCKMTLEVNTV